MVSGSRDLQATKRAWAQTDEEWNDVASDTGQVFAPATAVFGAALVCSLHAGLAGLIRENVTYWGGAIRERRRQKSAQP
jgi:hypothetical protein